MATAVIRWRGTRPLPDCRPGRPQRRRPCCDGGGCLIRYPAVAGSDQSFDEETRELGFDPILEARYETSTEYWLDIDTQIPAADVLDAILQGHPGLKLQGAACP
jgi:hypothetical protein